MSSILQVEGLTKSFGELVLFENISFGIREGDNIGLIAKNGSGKTTLLNILSGKEPYDSGNISTRRDLRIAYLEQDPQYPENLSVIEACFHSGNEITDLIAKYEQIINSEDHSQLDSVLQQMDVLQAWDYEHKAKQILAQLKITNFSQKISELSGGQLKRVALANVLITEPDLIILDEPTNHLDLDMVEWLEEYLQRSRLSLLMVTHDRYFLDRVCSEIIEIDQQQIYQYKGNYSYFLEKRDERISAQSADIDRANNLLRKELDWMRKQPRARGTKSRSRIDAYYELETKAKQTRDNSKIQFEMKGQYIGNKIFEANHVYKSFDDIKILEDFNYIFSRYEKMGVVGNNGTGKSTFIKMLMGEVQPDSGNFDIGETVKFGYYSQDGLEFDDQMKVIDVISNIAEVIDLGNGKKMTASQFLQHFLFPPAKQHDYVYRLSGGERRRLYLCTVLITNPNFLVLDEPTNDLDIQTLNVLEDYLTSFKGCVIVVSHDRYFMDKVVDHLLAFSGQAQIKDFPGNYSDYREWKEIKETEEKGMLQALDAAKTKEENPQPKQEKKEEKKKLTFNEKREFEELDALIPKLEKEKEEIETALSSGSLSNEELMEKSDRIGALIDEIDEKTMRWLELSEFM